MTTYRPPALDKAAPIVSPDGRITPYFQRFWQNLSFTAADGANASIDFTADIATLNAQMSALTLVVAGKAPLASPALTGNPTAPTQTQGNNSTRIATTAFVHTESVARATFTPWAAATGTADRTTFDTTTVTLAELAKRVKALVDDLKT